ncbi:hypothetical protein [Pseudomonas sp. UMAB-40]|uniref:hypothetical protein n=1 Tax=Pseudomonas sp. UMAB-40 TaxID=1365407 RepID=UPI001C5A5178|nr:hypothetical protein [Pseudomonas sp. UMAB-40]
MPVGFKALADRYDIALAQPLRVESEIGTARLSRESDGNVENRYSQLEDEDMAERVVEAVRSAFEDREMGTGRE